MHNGFGDMHWGFGFGHWGFGILVILLLAALIKYLMQK